MWSSLSSYLYSDDGAKPPGNVAVNHGRTRYPQIVNGSTPTGSSRGTPRARVARVESVDCRGLQTSLHSTSSNSSGGTRRIPQSPSSRLSVSNSEGDNATTILRAVVVGERRSGKTCLIQRLRGDDPFAKHRASESPRRRKRGTMALIPWALPNDSCCPTATVVQLYVSEGISFNYRTEDDCKEQWRANLRSQREKDIDFIIWMVDPRNSETAQALKHGLDLIIEESVVQNLCILLNFRDAQLSERTDQESSFHCIRREIDCAIDKLARKNEEMTERPQTIMVYESSMKNCFGLQNLHSFITLPYLAFLEKDLRRRADDACKQRLERRSSLLNSPPVSYNEYVGNVSGPANVRTEEPGRAELERQHLEAERESLRRRLKEQDRVLRGRLDADESISSNTKPKEVESMSDRQVEGSRDPTQRTIFVKSKTSQPAKPPKATTPKVVLEETLDSFFSDSESDGEQEEGVRGDVAEEVDDDDESDDGDFYIDGSGQPHAHIKSATKPDAPRPQPSDPAEAEVSRSEPAPANMAATEQIESNTGTGELPEGMRKAPEPIPDDVSTTRAPAHANGVAVQSRRVIDGFQEEKKEDVEVGGENRAAGVDPAPPHVAEGGADPEPQGTRKEDDGYEATATARARDESAEETGPLPLAGDPIDIADGDPALSPGNVENVTSKPSARVDIEDGSETIGDGKGETKPDENSLSASDGDDEDGRSRSQEEGLRGDVPLGCAGELASRGQMIPPPSESDDDAESSVDRIPYVNGGGLPSELKSDTPVPDRSTPKPDGSERRQ
ncbi:hypothetical protein THAOC_15082, partial [Thalassiosira oceanica]